MLNDQSLLNCVLVFNSAIKSPGLVNLKNGLFALFKTFINIASSSNHPRNN